MNRIILTLLSGVALTGIATAQQDVTLNFQALIGDQAAACGVTYDGVGAESSQIEVQDLRFYVSNLRLLNAAGEEVPLALTRDGQWQYENVALLDFEDGSARCAESGNAAMNTQVTGTVPEGEYTGLVYTVGVPFALNHADVATAPAPLNVSSMWWNWQAGYKHMRIDLMSHSAATNMAAAEETGEHGDAETDAEETGEHGAEETAGHGDAGGETGGDAEGAAGGHGAVPAGLWPIHLGSTGCVSDSGAVAPAAACAHPNVFEVRLDGFNPETDLVVADLSGLLNGVDLSQSLELAPPGCMSGGDDPDCSALFTNLSLTQGADAQTFFRSEAR